jgi:hypothetical protein
MGLMVNFGQWGDATKLLVNNGSWQEAVSAYVNTYNGWLQIYPTNGSNISPFIYNSSNQVVNQIDGTINTLLLGYIGSVTAGRYYYTWQTVMATSSVPPKNGWVTGSNTGHGGGTNDYITQSSAQQKSKTKQYVYYTTAKH